MPNKMPYPHPSEERAPIFDTQHEAATLVSQYQAAGHIKRCAYVVIHPTSSPWGRPQAWRPECEQDSFDVTIADPIKKAFMFNGCPHSYLLYKKAWKRKFKEWREDWWGRLRNLVVGPAQWFASLPATTQFVLLLIVLALLGSQWHDLIDLAKVILRK